MGACTLLPEGTPCSGRGVKGRSACVQGGKGQEPRELVHGVTHAQHAWVEE